MNPQTQEITLSKGPHRWRFVCDADGHKEMMVRLAELAREKDVPFDWFDAALVAHQMRARVKGKA